MWRLSYLHWLIYCFSFADVDSHHRNVLNESIITGYSSHHVLVCWGSFTFNVIFSSGLLTFRLGFCCLNFVSGRFKWSLFSINGESRARCMLNWLVDWFLTPLWILTWWFICTITILRRWVLWYFLLWAEGGLIIFPCLLFKVIPGLLWLF